MLRASSGTCSTELLAPGGGKTVWFEWVAPADGIARFARRRVEVRLALLNLTDQDYRLNPLNLTTELPRERLLAASLRFNF